jgi:DNA-directed RNA polymerase specialized sigma24 family protein
MNIPSTKSSAALEEFLRDFGPSLERALVARFGFEVGREAAAEASAYACEHWPRLVLMDNPVGYLFRVGQSAARRQHRWQRPSALQHDPVTVDSPVDLDLQRALIRLKPEQRIAVLLTCGFGCSHDEVAALLGTSPSNVSNHVSRGLTRLRRYIQP